MADTILAMAVGWQADRDTEASTMRWLNFPMELGWDIQLDKEVPKFKTNSRMEERRAFAKYNTTNIPYRCGFDSRDVGYLLGSAYGVPTSASNTHTFKMGQSGANSKYLTIYVYEDTGWMWVLIGAKVNVATVQMDVANAFLGMTGTIIGPKAVKRTSGLPTPAFTLPADKTPFSPWSTVVQRNAGPTRIVSMEVTVDNKFAPFYSTGLTFPAADADAGLSYERLSEGSVEGRYTLTARYDGTVAGEYEDTLVNTESAWILEARDVTTTPARVALFTLPKTIGLTPGRDLRNTVKLFSITGALLYSPGSATIATLALTNELTSYS